MALPPSPGRRSPAPSPLLRRTLAIGLGMVLSAVLVTPLSTQEIGIVAGRVTYAGTGAGVAGVLVTIPALHLGRLTDVEGRFVLEGVAAGSHEIVAALVGCHLASRSVEVRADDRLDVAFELAPPVIGLEGLIVTAFGDGTTEAEVPFAVGRLDPLPERLSASTGVADLIRGRVAGARVLQGSGQPGDPASILLRGPTSIQSGQGPLVVVDGVVTHGVPRIDPLDVEHVEVLRGATGAAHYGARGQAGVIEITTRRGPAAPDRPEGPLVVVDGAADGRTLADVDPRTIAAVRVLDGPAAAILYGARAEGGVIHVTTVGAGIDAARPPFCVDVTG